MALCKLGLTGRFGAGLLVLLSLMGAGAVMSSAAPPDTAKISGKEQQAPPPAPAPKVDPARKDYPALAPVANPDRMGRGVQRTMTLLATSTPQKRNKVKILFYGQSITEQDWWKQVADDLRRRFPHADLEIQNRAIGGFASQRLIRPAEHDVYPFYPDLVIFHVYGAHDTYEQIIRNIRSRTTAEVLMQRDHCTEISEVPATEKAQDKNKGAWWDEFMNGTVLPDVAQKYGCGLVDVRGQWRDYLEANNLRPKALLSDDVHLNAQGNFVMAEIIKRYLVYRPELASTVNTNAVKTLVVGKDVKWQNGKLTVPFTGNRVDVVYTPIGKPASPNLVSVNVTVDGKNPREFGEMYAYSRPMPNPWSPLSLSRVDRENKPVPSQDWTLTVTSVANEGKSWEYKVEGSATGLEGTGNSDKAFASASGYVQIAPESWFRAGGNLEPGYQITWKTVPLFRPVYVPDSVEAGQESAVTVAQNLPYGKHVLELTLPHGKNSAKVDPKVTAVRVYNPPVK